MTLAQRRPLGRYVRRRPRWRLPSGVRTVFSNRVLQLVLAAFSVAILLLSSDLNVGDLSTPGNHARVESGVIPQGNNSSLEPYQIPTSMYPAPSPLPSQVGNSTWARTASSEVGPYSFYSVAYVQTDLVGNESLVCRLGAYNTSLAMALANRTACLANCPWNLPIAWSSPVTVASLGHGSVQGSALVAVNSTVAVAVDVGGATSVYFSPSLGTGGTWMDVTGETPVAGGSPNLTLWPCQGLLLTTLTSTNLSATTLPLPCQTAQSPIGTQRPLGPQFPPSAPYVTSLTPSTSTPGAFITIYGGDFASGATVRFGPWSSPSVSYVNSQTLYVEVPNGAGVVDVTVTVNGVTSVVTTADEFTYTGPAPPTVSSVSPTQGLPGTAVTVNGANFTAGSSVEFGAVYSSSVTVLATTQLTAVAPPNHGSVYISVTTAGGTSSKSSATEFSYERPLISALTPSIGYPTATLMINGANFSVGASVTFGSLPALAVNVVGTTTISAEIPWGMGTTEVRVTNPGGSESSVTSHTRFTWVTTPQLGNRTTQLLPPATSAWPVWSPPALGFNSTMGILASNSSDQAIVFYHTTQVGSPFTMSPVAPYLATSGSPIFTSIGGTRLETPGGPGGLVSATDIGPVVFGLFTTRSENRTVVESVTSEDYGVDWGQPYLAASIVGSVTEPAIATSPAGYIYATWAENGAGPWQVDAQQFDPTGRPLGNATAFLGSQGASTSGAQDPSVAVDGLHRALYVWTALGSSGTTQIDATGGYLLPRDAIAYLWASLNATASEDFNHSASSSQITTYKSNLGTNLSGTLADLAANNLCSAHRAVVRGVYGYLTWSPSSPFYSPSTLCGQIKTVSPLIARASGPTSANFSLAIETQWLIEALGYGLFATPDWSSLVSTDVTSAPVPYSTGDASSDGTNFLAVTATGVNPKTVALNASADFPGVSSSTRSEAAPDCLTEQYPPSGIPTTYTFTNTDAPINYSTQVWTNSSQSQTYVTNGTLLQVYLTDLTPRSSGIWHEKVTVAYQQVFTEEKECGGVAAVVNRSIVPIQTGWPITKSLSAQGAYSTYFGYSPGNLSVNVSADASGLDHVEVNWTNSLYGYGSTTLLDLGNGSKAFHLTRSTGRSPVLGEDWVYDNVSMNRTIIAYANTTSESGTENGSWAPTFDAGQVTYNTSAAVAAASCVFTTGPNPIHLYWSPTTNVTGVTGTTAVLTWWSNSHGIGWVRYKEAYGPWLLAGTTEFGSSGNYTYEASLKGLAPWGIYTAIVGVTAKDVQYSCESFSQTADWTFRTAAKFQLSEQDLPYDSITHEGGGAVVTWEIPFEFILHASFVSGVVSYFPVGNNSSVEIPLTTLPGLYYCANCYSMNLTALTPNDTYNLTIDLNFTYGGTTVNGTSFPFTFWYAKDTSGDGLTDWEKTRGWEVTYQNLSGSWVNTLVKADPELYSTNGLTNDYEEKLYGLNPNTIDSAGSHMLDPWNLTFALPGNGPSCPATFECWYENSTNPFSNASYPGGSHSGTAAFINNTTGPHTAVDDSSAYDAMGIWSSARIAYLQGLIRSDSLGWLRAVVGYYAPAHDWTLTVEGKLSWGANPLATSTPGDGLPDGARVNPLGGSYVNVTVTGWDDTEVNQGDGVAAFLNATSSALGGSGFQTDYRGYTEQVTAGAYGNGGRSLYGGNLDLTYTFPVLSDEQFARFNVSLVQNVSGNVSNALDLGPVVVDLANSSFHTSSTTSASASLSVTCQALTVFSKAPTYILIPKDNSSLSSLPLGLQRYTAEQNFVLVVVNATANDTYNRSVTGINYPLANGTTSNGTYGVTLSKGLNNFLIPRALFLNTPFGQDVLNNTTIPIPGTNGTLGNWGLDQWYNGAQWRARATLNGYGGYNYTNTSGFLTIYSNSASQNCTGHSTLCGGAPSNPKLEAGNESLAIQAVMTLNLSSYGAVADFLSALLFNSSGNYTGWLFGATQYLPSLGIASNVMGALANPVLANAGAFSAPTSSNNNPLSDWGVVGAVIWNVVSGVAGAIEVLWNAVLAAAAFINYLIDKVGGWLLGALQQTMAVLEQVASVIASALGRLLSFISTFLTGIIGAIVSPVGKAFSNAISAWSASLFAATGQADEAYLGHSPTQNRAEAAHNLSLVLAPILLGGIALSVILGVALGVTEPLDLVAGFLLGIVLTVIMEAFSVSGMASAKNSFVGRVSALANGVVTTTVTALSSVGETLFNLTEGPLNSSAASAIAIPDGDPWAAFGLAFALVGITSATVGLLKASAGIAEALAWVGFYIAAIGLIFAASALALSLTLPSGCPSNALVEYQGLTYAAVAGLVIAIAGMVATVVGLKGTQKVVALSGLGAAAAGASVAVIEIGADATACGI